MRTSRVVALLVAALVGTSCINVGGPEEFVYENGVSIVRDGGGRLLVVPEPCVTSDLAALRVVDVRPGSAEKVVLDVTFDPPIEELGLVIPLDPFSSDGLNGITEVVVDEAGLAAALAGGDAELVVSAAVWMDYPDGEPVEKPGRFKVGELGPKQAFDYESTLYADASNVECARGRDPFPGVFAD